MKKLIVNADDFGMSKEINEGIMKGIEEGIITSVSLMVNMPYFEQAIKFLKKHPQVSAGLHFNITEGKPLTQTKDVGTLLREDEAFYSWPLLFLLITTKRVKPKEIERELKLQFTKLKSYRANITHIDSHHHIHLIPTVFKTVNDLARENNILSLRTNEFNLWNINLNAWKKPTLTQTLVNLMLLYNNFKNRSIKYPYGINRFYDINWGKDLSTEEFANILKNMPEGTTELICHLAMMSKTGNKNFIMPRYNTLKLLTHPMIKKHLISNGITLIPHLDNTARI